MRKKKWMKDDMDMIFSYSSMKYTPFQVIQKIREMSGKKCVSEEEYPGLLFENNLKFKRLKNNIDYGLIRRNTYLFKGIDNFWTKEEIETLIKEHNISYSWYGNSITGFTYAERYGGAIVC